MILLGVIRNGNMGYKRVIRLSGYESPADLAPARTTAKAYYPFARAILFLVPKPGGTQ